jgi:hypothetical protein
MARFLRKLAILLLPLGLCLAVWELLLAYRVPINMRSQRLHLEQQVTEIELLILGSSYSAEGINPHLFKAHAFNLANPAQSLYYDAALLDRYVDRMPKLKTVVLSVGYATLFTELTSTRQFLYYRFFDIPPRVERLLAAVDARRFSLVALLSSSVYATLRKYGQPTTIDRLGWDDDGVVAGQGPILGDSLVTFSHGEMKEAHLPSNLRYLNRLIGQAHQHGAETILVSTPLHETFFRAMNPSWYGRMQASLQVVCRTPGVRCLDYMKDARFGVGDFREDAIHLTQSGAAKFTTILARDLGMGQ